MTLLKILLLGKLRNSFQESRIDGLSPASRHNMGLSLTCRTTVFNIALCLATILGNGFPGVAKADERPNILFVFTDDQPQNCMGCLGNNHIQTPNMDRLAREGVLFTNAFTTTAICCSNRACILTGQYMRRHGIQDFATPLSNQALDSCYPMLLRAAGYRTGYLGKFAVGRPDPEIASLSLPEQKFDFWYGFPQSINFQQEEGGEQQYLTSMMEQKALEFFRSQPKDQPFCLTVALKEPHGPWNYFDPEVSDSYADRNIPFPKTFSRGHFEALPEFLRESLGGRGAGQRLDDPDILLKRTRTFYRLISRADLALGRLRNSLKETGLDQNTIIIYSSDHGSLMGAHGLNGKWLMYEESIRVPMIVFDPRLPAETRNQRRPEMVLSIDLAPTMLALASVEIPSSVQGESLLPLLQGKHVEWRDDWYYEHTYANPPVHPIPRTEGVRTTSWKFVRYPELQPPYEQLFDLANDPLEENNLVGKAEHATILAQLRSRCDEYRDSLR